MRFLTALCLFCLLASIPAQDRASFRRSNDRSGRCQYSFTVDSPTEASCPGPGGADIQALQSRLTLLEALVSRLAGGETGTGTMGKQAALQEKYAQVAAERTRLQRDKERLDAQVQELQGRLSELQLEAQRLRAKPCQLSSSPGGSLQGGDQRASSGSSIFPHLVSRPGGPSETAGASDPSWQFGRAAYQEFKAEVTELPAPRPNRKGDEDRCGELVSVSDPETHRKADGISGKYGMWLQDPNPIAPYGPKTVWRMDAVGADVRQLFAYEDKEQLARGFPTKVLLLPEPVESTGATVYRGSLYYQRRRSRTLLRYDLASESVAARRDLPHAGFHGQYPYSWGGYTDIDLAVDEQGLWAIYSTSKAKGGIVLSQLDPHSLEIRRSWETNIRKNMVANAFVICGRLYTLASYSAPNTTINYTFDTATGQSKAVAIPFRNLYRYNSMVDYNYANRKLYAWDNFHMVSYDVQLGDPDNI
ncbi:myocilin-like [Scleropages formosus]|uniref:Myocilin n=1 Tax=Scleropages formosus TaxID=113540 RepID=A0A8C9RTG2_SCLFO|nr:myocilin-like [Scleropages formosus]